MKWDYKQFFYKLRLWNACNNHALFIKIHPCKSHAFHASNDMQRLSCHAALLLFSFCFLTVLSATIASLTSSLARLSWLSSALLRASWASNSMMRAWLLFSLFAILSCCDSADLFPSCIAVSNCLLRVLISRIFSSTCNYNGWKNLW